MATASAAPADFRPHYHPGHLSACEPLPGDRLTITPYTAGEEQQTWRQVGWLGASGAMYGLYEKPSQFEGDSFRPMWVQIE